MDKSASIIDALKKEGMHEIGYVVTLYPDLHTEICTPELDHLQNEPSPGWIKFWNFGFEEEAREKMNHLEECLN